MRTALALLACIATACAGSSVDDSAPSCPHQADSWIGGLRSHLLQVDQDGIFDYEPVQDHIARVQGSWDERSGAFSWKLRYAAGHYLVSEAVTGSASFAAGGDLQLERGTLQRDVLGATSASYVWESWQGCAFQRESESEAEGLLTQVSTVGELLDDERLVQVSASPSSPWTVTTERYADLSAHESHTSSDGESWYEADEPGDGTRQVEFWLRDGDGLGYEEGGYLRSFEGTRAYDFRRYPEDGSWDVLHKRWVLRYDGSGHGSVVGEKDGETLTCKYIWDSAGVGSYLCDDGQSGPY